MEVKKTKKADLEKKRGVFFQMGIVVALGASLVAFEWKNTTDLMEEIVYNSGGVTELELPPIVIPKEPEAAKPVPPKISVEKILIVEDETEILEDYDFSVESTEDLTVALADLDLGDEDNGDPIPFMMLEDKPEFPGGQKALLTYLAKAVDYPIIAQDNGIQGTVYLTFVISKTGNVKDVKIIRGVDSSLDKEALRVVSSMPKWKPGKQRNKPVAVSFQVPIRFSLR